jgi:hypothetical protein
VLTARIKVQQADEAYMKELCCQHSECGEREHRAFEHYKARETSITKLYAAPIISLTSDDIDNFLKRAIDKIFSRCKIFGLDLG